MTEPKWLTFLRDRLLEGLSTEDALSFVEEFSKLPESSDYDSVKWSFLIFLLEEQKELVLQAEIKESLKQQVLNALIQVSETVNETMGTVYSMNQKAKAQVVHDFVTRALGDASRARNYVVNAANSVAHFAIHAVIAHNASIVRAAHVGHSDIANAVGAATLIYNKDIERQDAYKRYADELLRLLKELK